MDVGVALMFANFSDWERAQKRPDDPIVADTQFYRDELATGDLVEPLGFDSLWTAEHHFAPYCMEPNPLQLLTYFASRTERIDLGTCVVVVPGISLYGSPNRCCSSTTSSPVTAS